jgi:hypothetical protein
LTFSSKVCTTTLVVINATSGGNVDNMQQELLWVVARREENNKSRMDEVELATRGGNVMIVVTLPPLVPTNINITAPPVWQDVTYTFLTSRLAETVLLVNMML